MSSEMISAISSDVALLETRPAIMLLTYYYIGGTRRDFNQRYRLGRVACAYLCPFEGRDRRVVA